MNGYSWRTSIASMGGRLMFGVSAAVREATGVDAEAVLAAKRPETRARRVASVVATLTD